MVDGHISPEKIEEVVDAVSNQLRQARRAAGGREWVLEPAPRRRFGSRPARPCAGLDAVYERCGLEVEIVCHGRKEARVSAFVGVAGTLEHEPAGDLGVVDVGGGSSELIVGRIPNQIAWSASLPVGSGELAHTCLPSDPPELAELAEARRRVASALDTIDVPKPAQAAAVGGSAASLATLVGTLLNPAAFTRCVQLLASEPAARVAAQYGLAVERVRLLPAGLLILQGVAERFGLPLEVGRGGLREGILLEGSRA